MDAMADVAMVFHWSAGSMLDMEYKEFEQWFEKAIERFSLMIKMNK